MCSNGDDFADKPIEFQRLDALKLEGEQKAQEFQRSAEADERSGLKRPSKQSVQLLREFKALNAKFHKELQRVQEHFGLSEEFLQEIERAEREARLGDREDRWWQRDIGAIDPTAFLDELTGKSLERLMSTVDSDWLSAEAAKSYRLDDNFLRGPLHIVSNIRVSDTGRHPQRFARMLLTAQDHLNRRDALDFFEASWAVPELAMLGASLDQLRELGPEAIKKFERLPKMDDVQVSSTIYELLVGSAFVRRGRDVRMLPEDKQRKVPDFEIAGMGVPMAAECKRRFGLADYEAREAALIERLYLPVRELLREDGRHISIEAAFTVEVREVPVAEFLEDVRSLLVDGDSDSARPTRWGSLATQTLPYYLEIQRTRLYSPDFLQSVFGWSRMGNQWDGLLCEVDPPHRVIVTKARNPNCLKWVSLSAGALIKKARGVSSVWGGAAQQLRPGEMGLIYIAYTEGGREAVADARTRHIMDTCQHWYTRWSVTPAMTVINRLYPRALGAGSPDLIESSIPITIDGDEAWLGMFPVNVFTTRLRGDDE